MDLPRALEQIRDIHAALDRAAVYRGYRAAPVAASGLIGVIAAAVQPPALAASDPIGFTTYWLVIALIAVAIGSSEIVYNYFVRDDDRAQRGTREALGQFLPGLAAAFLLRDGRHNTQHAWQGRPGFLMTRGSTQRDGGRFGVGFGAGRGGRPRTTCRG